MIIEKGVMILVSEEENSTMQETFYLLRSPRNAERLLRSVEAVEAGRYEEKDLEGRSSASRRRDGKTTSTGSDKTARYSGKSVS